MKRESVIRPSERVLHNFFTIAIQSSLWLVFDSRHGELVLLDPLTVRDGDTMKEHHSRSCRRPNIDGVQKVLRHLSEYQVVVQ